MGGVVSAVGGIVGGLIGGSKQASATKSAADTAAAAERYAADIQKEMFERQVELREPWRQAGINALGAMQAQRMGMPPAFTGQVDLTQDPGYAFRLSEGLKALDRTAAARGNLLSGGQMKAAQRFGQDLASQEYQNAYQRALTQYNAATQREATGYNRLAGLAGIGQTATNEIGSAAQKYGTSAANLAMVGGANQANALLQQGNIMGSMYGGIGQALGGVSGSDWSKLGNTVGNWFSGGSMPSADVVGPWA